MCPCALRRVGPGRAMVIFQCYLGQRIVTFTGIIKGGCCRAWRSTCYSKIRIFAQVRKFIFPCQILTRREAVNSSHEEKYVYIRTSALEQRLQRLLRPQHATSLPRIWFHINLK